MIDGVKTTPLKQISDERGKVMHMLRNDSEIFESFGEIYFSCINPGVVKGWNKHKKMILNFAVPLGEIKVVVFDDRNGSPTQGKFHEVFLSPENYQLVTIPPLLWTGFQCTSSEMAIVANCASIPHNPDEIERCDPFDSKIPYTW